MTLRSTRHLCATSENHQGSEEETHEIGPYYHPDPQCTWSGLHGITDCKVKNWFSAQHTASLPDVLHTFFAFMWAERISTLFKSSIIWKKPVASCLNHYCFVALTSVIMNCFEWLVKVHISSSLPDTMDPLEFAQKVREIHGWSHHLGNTNWTHTPG